MKRTFEYPKVLKASSPMYKERVTISNDNAIFQDRKALLEKHFREYPIYLSPSYYAKDDRFPMVERNGDDFKGYVWNKLSNWRDCHYYQLCEWQGHRFFIMTGGRYD